MTKFAKLNRELSEKVELQLPNGGVLKSKFLYGKGGFWRTYSFVNPGQVKEQMPLVGCLSSDTDHHLFCFDFDKLPIDCGSWEELVERLRDMPGFMVARSPSRKVKAFLVFRWAGFPDKRAIIERAYSLLPQAMVNALDRSGCFTFFLSGEIAQALSDMNESLVYN